LSAATAVRAVAQEVGPVHPAQRVRRPRSLRDSTDRVRHDGRGGRLVDAEFDPDGEST